MYVYSYDVMGYQDSEAFNVSVAGKPSMTAISVEDYNTLAQNFNNKLGSNEQEKKVKLIGSNFGLGTPGDPMTYRKSFPSTELSGSGDGLTNYYGSEGSTQKTISKSTTTNNGYDIQISNDRYAGAEVLGIGVKFTFGIAAGTGGNIAIKKADPYGTADNNGNGKKWAALTVVPEVYATAADGKGYAVDYHSNGTADTSGSSLDGMFFMQATAGLNLGNGKDSAVARLSLSTAAGGDGGLYLTICDPVNGGWLTDGNVTCIGTVSHNGGTPYQTQNFTGKSLTSSNSHAITYDAYAVSKRINYFSSVNNNVKGQYMAIATGDFDGDGSDSIIVYVPEYKAPKIQEFGKK